jgi:hypothetical protein
MAELSGLSPTDASNTSISGANVAEGCPPSAINDAIRAIAGMLARDWQKKGPVLTAGGTANGITLTPASGLPAYVQGEVVSFVAAATNTGPATVNVSGLGAKAITKNGATALQGGEIVNGAVVTMMYDGAQFQLVSNSPTEATCLWGGTSGGTSNAQTVTLIPAPGAYYPGMVVTFLAGATNTGACTLNCNSLGAKNVFVANAACTGGELLSGKAYTVVYDGTQFQLLSPVNGSHGGLIGVQVFSTAGTSTYAPTPGTSSVVVEVLGAGGGGGGVASTGAGQIATGGGAGAGGYARKRITSSFSGVTVTVGAKGTGGAAGANNGTDGGTSSFGALASATGGSKGPGGSAGSSPNVIGSNNGGTGSSGDINITGAKSPPNFVVSTGVGLQTAGANSLYGSGGPAAGTGTGLSGGNASGFGAGGGGAVNCASQASGLAGGNGADGLVIVWEYS